VPTWDQEIKIDEKYLSSWVLSLVALSLADFTASAQTVTELYSFSFDSSKGKGPVYSLIADEQGALYGTTMRVAPTAMARFSN
jgi:hypothetical protein